tara:strand:+ start:804 stop:1139 length:336 start_codon:yes stop_codon:yes gene_type:complete
MADDIQEEPILPVHGKGNTTKSGYQGAIGVSKNIKIGNLSIEPSITQFQNKDKNKGYKVKGNQLGIQSNYKINKNVSFSTGASTTKGKVKHKEGKDKFKGSSWNVGIKIDF